MIAATEEENTEAAGLPRLENGTDWATLDDTIPGRRSSRAAQSPGRKGKNCGNPARSYSENTLK